MARGSRRQAADLLQVGLLEMYETEAQHVDCRLTLLQNDVTQERFVHAVGRLHVEKDESPPPTIVTADEAATALAMASVPAAN